MQKIKESSSALLFMFLLSGYAWACPEIIVIGSNTPLLLKNQAALHLAFLQIEEKILVQIKVVSDIPEPYRGVTLPAESADAGHPLIFQVYIDKGLPPGQQQLVLAHEMVHVKQYVKEGLEKTGNRSVRWKGKKYTIIPEDMHHMPWEREAYRMDHKLVKMADNTRRKMEQDLLVKNLYCVYPDSCLYEKNGFFHNDPCTLSERYSGNNQTSKTP